MNNELTLLATMLYRGDFTPVLSGQIEEEHFETIEGKTLYKFIRNYRGETGGQAQYPSYSVTKMRFKSSIELPEPEPGETVTTLAYEVRVDKYRSELRQIASELETVAGSADDPVAGAAPYIAELRRSVEKQQQTPHVSLANGIMQVAQNYDQGEILPDGIPWPWELLTQATKGLHKGDFVVFGGRPKSRKTFTALRVGMHALKHHQQRVLVFSPEMTVRQIFLRCVAHLCDLPYAEFKNGAMQDAEEMRLFDAADIYGRMKEMDDAAYQFQLLDRIPNIGDTYPSLDIVQSTGRDTAWMKSMIELYTPTLVIADSFYRQRPLSGRRNDADWKAVTMLSREMKEMAMEMKVPIIGTHQLNRSTEKSGVGDLSNLALADAIGQDADRIYRVITGKSEGQSISLIVTLGDRDSPFDGVVIRNEPCHDYRQIGEIKNQAQILDLLRQEDAAEAREENERLRAAIRGDAPRVVVRAPQTKGEFRGRNSRAGGRSVKDMVPSKFAEKVEASTKAMLEKVEAEA